MEKERMVMHEKPTQAITTPSIIADNGHPLKFLLLFLIKPNLDFYQSAFDVLVIRTVLRKIKTSC
jgi:hypothetical protein